MRDGWLKARGYRVLRFWNHGVLRNTEGVLTAITSILEGEAGADKGRDS